MKIRKKKIYYLFISKNRNKDTKDTKETKRYTERYTERYNKQTK